jgi:hypothetical protein
MRGTGGQTFFRNGVVTSVALLLVYAAFDDIATDNATAFPVEYSLLVVCGAWLFFVAWDLVRRGYRFPGGVSVLAAAAAVWGQRAIVPGGAPGFRLEAGTLIVAYLWFWALSFWLLWSGRRRRLHTEVYDLLQP